MTVLRRTWLATTLFVSAPTAFWWWFADWAAASQQLLPTLLLSPPIWWFIVGRHARPSLARGVVGGVIVGVATQSAQDVLRVLNLLSNRGMTNGDEQAIAIASVAAYLLIALFASVGGGLLGLVAVAIERLATRVRADLPAGR